MDKEISAAMETLQKGGIILYPTDTIWGYRLRCHQQGGSIKNIQHKATQG